MKFLCVQCDAPMKLRKSDGPDEGGSLSVLFYCPDCNKEIAMLTNPYETQLVSSLGIKIGGTVPGSDKTEGSKCPFSDVVQKAMSGSSESAASGPENVPTEIFAWTEEASSRLEKIPFFVRPMAKMGIEKFAKDSGYGQVDGKVLDEAKEKFGM